jgi:hypothetical protein
LGHNFASLSGEESLLSQGGDVNPPDENTSKASQKPGRRPQNEEKGVMLGKSYVIEGIIGIAR